MSYLRTLRFRLLLLIGLALLPIAALVLYNAAEERDNARRTTEEQALLTTQLAASSYSVYIAATDDMLAKLAADVVMRLPDATQCDAQLRALVEATPFFADIWVADTNGAISCGAGSHKTPLHTSEEQVIRRSVETGALAVGTFYIDRSGRPILPFAYPIAGDADSPQRSIVIDVDVIVASYSLGIEQLPDGAVFTVLDANGTVVLHYPDAEMWTGQTIGDGRLMEAARGRTPVVVEASDVDGVRRLSGVYPLGPPWSDGTVIVGIDSDVAYAPANNRLVRGMVSLAIVATIAMITVWIGGDVMLVRGVTALIRTTRQLAAGNLAARSGLTRAGGELGSLAGAVDDMAQALQHRDAQLTYQAFHDPVTGLPNRTWFLERLERPMALPAQSDSLRAVLFVDLDNFKVVNDSLGHAAGDRLLTTIGDRLARCLNPNESLARFGGDEFTVLVEHLSDVSAAQGLAERLMAELNEPVQIEGRDIIVTASIGVATGAGIDEDPDSLLRYADIAMYQAKSTGKDRIVTFDDAMQRGSMERLELETDLRQAIARGELEVWYQPEISLEHDRIVGVEALLRWRHATRGLIFPSTFIPLAEETGLIVPIGRWLIEEACRQVKQWQAMTSADEPLLLSVNISARQFAEPSFVDDVRRALDETGFEPASLWLEITESVLMKDADAAITTLQAIGDLGVRFALDDFGTGYSSLNYLRRFPFDMLKIDKSFIDNLDDPGTMAIVQSVTTLAHALGKQVTTEGIETSEQVELVRTIGCDWVQGYYFARPLPPDEMALLLDLSGPPIPVRGRAIEHAA